MIAVDTNVLVRLLTKDDRDQAKRAAKLFGENEIFIPLASSRDAERFATFDKSFLRNAGQVSPMNMLAP